MIPTTLKKIIKLISKYENKTHKWGVNLLLYGDGSGRLRDFNDDLIYSFDSVNQLKTYLKIQNKI